MSSHIFQEGSNRINITTNNQGIIVTVPCQLCEEENKILHSWNEVQALLENRAVAGVQPTSSGWRVTFHCHSGGCPEVNVYELGEHELQNLARNELSRRNRIAKMRGHMPAQQPVAMPRRGR